uniref:Uncharacterized protein n=1 Tax=Branchiostoma floridae TaxID=7739 RepID=C3YM88_BRAFL|eukprot:XP_002602670.1 hypothetical protein BRAFLDRAFT_72961 [Branchiostoma floridae]
MPLHFTGQQGIGIQEQCNFYSQAGLIPTKETGRISYRSTTQLTKAPQKFCKVLLKSGADPNARDNSGITPVHSAAYSGHVRTVHALIQGGADPNQHDMQDGKTAEEVVGQHLRCREPVSREHGQDVLKAFREYQTNGAAQNGRGVSQCKTAGWRECVPFMGNSGITASTFASGTYACVLCETENDSVAALNPFSGHVRANIVAVRGYPFRVLFANKLTHLDHSVVGILALVDSKITDVKNDTFARFSRLYHLSLDCNLLANVRQAWFTGLEKLRTLVLSNNRIKQIESGSFVHLTNLYDLDLENNMLQVVDPNWLFGLKRAKVINLGLNEINSISPGSFRNLQLNCLELGGKELSSLDVEVFRGQPSLLMLCVSSDMLASAHSAKPHGMAWSLRRFTNIMSGSATLVVEVPKFVFCARHTAYELSFAWVFDSSSNMPGSIEMGRVNPGISCGALDRSLSTVSIQAPAVVLTSDNSLTNNSLEQCRQVWEYDRGITVTVGPEDRNIFRMVSMTTYTGNMTIKSVAMSFTKTPDTTTISKTKSKCSDNHSPSIKTSHNNAKNISCILLTKDEHTELTFTVPTVQCLEDETTTANSTDTHYSISMIHHSKYTEKDFTSSELGGNTTFHVSTTTGQATHHVLVSVVVWAVVSLVVLVLVVFIRKLCSSSKSDEDARASDDAHFWTIPPGVAFPGLLRSASLPSCSRKMASDDVDSCRSLPAVLHSIEPTYSEIPDDIAAAQRPLPDLPHTYWEIPDAGMAQV